MADKRPFSVRRLFQPSRGWELLDVGFLAAALNEVTQPDWIAHGSSLLKVAWFVIVSIGVQLVMNIAKNEVAYANRNLASKD